jgi:NAD(P)-dependent dehydrogenase (short-subunit alcohol dehydrogenase family)
VTAAAIVTGAGRGVGRVVASELGRAGLAVAAVSRTAAQIGETARLIERAGGRAVAHVADVTQPEEVKQLVSRVAEELGPVELLVNNAGTAAAIGPTWEVDADLWWRDVETSVRGTFLCTRAVLPGMLRRGGGRIVNVSSYAGTRPSPYMSAYAAAKAALANFTESVAAEVADRGVKVFTMTPGLFESTLLEGLMSDENRRWLPAVGSGRVVEPEEVARLVRFIASGAGDALSGRFLHALDDVEAIVTHAHDVTQNDLLTLRLRRFEPPHRQA